MGGSRPRPLGRSLFSAIAACAALAGCADSEPPVAVSEYSVLMEGNIFGGALQNKQVVLTFDDGPDEYTLELAQYLNDEGISAIFFINGRRFCKTWSGTVCTEPMETRPCNDGQSQAPVDNPIYYPETLLDEIIALGHRIGNHTTDHCHLNGQDDPEDFAFELSSTQEIVDRHICDGIFFFRAPFGAWDGQAASLAQAVPALDKLIGPVNWDVDGGDWDCFPGTSVEECGDGYLGGLSEQDGQKGIFLQHDRLEFDVGSNNTLLMTQYMVPRLKEQGYTFTTLEDMLDLTPDGPMACQPPPGMGGSGGTGGTAGTGGTGGTGGTAGAGGTGGVGGVAGSAGTAGGGSGGGGMTGTAGAAPRPPVAASADEGSCAVGHGSRSGGFGIVSILLGLLLWGRRRKA